jgi:hypothetical protein
MITEPDIGDPADADIFSRSLLKNQQALFICSGS